MLKRAIIAATAAVVFAVIGVGVRNRNAAAEFLKDWLRRWEDEQAITFQQNSINDYDVWVARDDKQAYALTGDSLVFATSEETLGEVLDRVAGKQTRTLASAEEFMEARAALPERRFTSIYVDYRRVSDVVSDLGAPGLLGSMYPLGPAPMGSMEELCNGTLSQTPDWIMMSGAWMDRGLVFSTISPAVDDIWPEASEVGDVAELLPTGTLGFFSVSFDPNVYHWRVAFRECKMADLLPFWGEVGMRPEEINEAIALAVEATSLPGQAPADDPPKLAADSNLADALDLGLWTIDQILRIHLEDDLFDYLGGDVFVALHDVELEESLAGEPSDNGVDVVWILSYRSDGETKLRESVNRLTGRLESLIGLEVEQTDVGAGSDAYVFKWDGQGVQSGYVIHDGYLTFGTTEGSIQATVARQKGEGDRLSAGAEYLRTVGHLPVGRQFLAYLDLGRIMSKVNPDLAELDLGMDRELFDVVPNSLSAVAISSSAGDAYDRSTLALSFLPGK